MTLRFFLIPNGDDWTVAEGWQQRDGWHVLWTGSDVPSGPYEQLPPPGEGWVEVKAPKLRR